METDNALCFFCREAPAVHSCTKHDNCRVKACDRYPCKQWIDASILDVLQDAYEGEGR